MGIGASIVLLALGAMLAWAVDVNDATVGSVTVAWNTVGYILMLVGALGLAWSALLIAGRRGSRDDAEIVEQRRRVL